MEAILKGPFGNVTLGSSAFAIGRSKSDNQLVLPDTKVSLSHVEIVPRDRDIDC